MDSRKFQFIVYFAALSIISTLSCKSLADETYRVEEKAYVNAPGGGVAAACAAGDELVTGKCGGYYAVDRFVAHVERYPDQSLIADRVENTYSCKPGLLRAGEVLMIHVESTCRKNVR